MKVGVAGETCLWCLRLRQSTYSRLKPLVSFTSRPSIAIRTLRLSSRPAAATAFSVKPTPFGESDPLGDEDQELPRPNKDPSKPLQRLTRPLGFSSAPQPGENTGVDSRSMQERRDDFVNYDKHLIRRKQLIKKVARPYFTDWTALNVNKGKTWRAPPALFKADRALFFPNLRGQTLSGRERDLANVLKDRVSLVVVYSGLWAEHQTNTFVGPGPEGNPEMAELLQESEKAGTVQRIDINIEENWMRANLVKLFMPSIRRKLPESRHGLYFLVRKGLTDPLRNAIGFINSKVGYVFLLDKHARIRWAACGTAEPDEKIMITKGLKRLLEGKPVRAGL